ncbi:MAG: hypothetical protein Q8N99_04450 [Nanoarchaeota archaeon]|nr:hypothetical protein [Nanoarchaeota archaeon]
MAKKGKTLGAWAFLVGVLVALILGILTGLSTEMGIPDWTVWILVLAGILIGVLNVSEVESKNFLLAALALVIVASQAGEMLKTSLSQVKYLGPMLSNTLIYLLVLFVPTTIIVALKSVFNIAKN